MLETADFKTCARIQPKRGWCFVRKLFLCVFLCLFPIFSFATTLPSGYTQLEYIESTGTQYIDTGLKFATSDTRLDYYVKCSVEHTDGISTRFLSNVAVSDKGFDIGFQDGKYNFITYSAPYDNDTSHYVFTLPTGTQTLEITGYFTSSAFYNNYMSNVYEYYDYSPQRDDTNIFLFAYSSNVKFYSGKMYSVKLTIDNVLKRDFVPAKRNSDGAIGMFDTVTNTFFENIGTGTFIAGPSVILPNEYTRLEYIESTGTQYIDTGVVPANGFGFEVDVMPLTEITTATYAMIGGSSKRNNGSWGGVVLGTWPTDGSQGQMTWFQLAYLYDPGFVAYSRCTMKNINNHFTSSTGKDYYTPYLTDSEINGNLYLFAINSDVGVRYGSAGIRLYSCKLYNGTTVIRNFIPAKRNSDNVVGLYDTVNGVFYTNSGTGSFIAGPAVDDPGVSEPSCEYTRLEYLKSSDAQYIQDNSFQPISTGAIEIKTKDLRTYTRFAGWDGLVALATPNSVTNYFPFLYGSWDDYNPNPVSIAAENALRYEFEPGLQKLYVNGVFNRQAQKNTSIYSAPFRMFIVSTGGGYNHGSTIYYCRVYDGNNVLLRNYIPVRRNSDNVLGMYDTVTKTFFTNAGTGTFVAGPTVSSNNNCQTINITWGGLAEPDASGMCVYGETFTAPSIAPTAPSGLKFLGWIPRQ